ncbi:MAG: hypothetical protein R6T96_03150 [Longimicrobiales bacterium]
MMGVSIRRFIFALLLVPMISGCASTSTKSGENPDLLTREQIEESGATNLYDIVNRLRPRWLQVRGTRSFNMETEIVVLQNEMVLGGPEALKQMDPSIAFEIRYLEGARAAAAIPGLMSGRHIEGAIIVSTRPH